MLTRNAKKITEKKHLFYLRDSYILGGHLPVIPAKAGIQIRKKGKPLDSSFCWNDTTTFYHTMSETYLTIKEATEYLGVTPLTLRN